MKSYRGEIEKRVPELRQYARALVADHRPDVADDLVRDALAHALRAERGWMGEDVAVRLYTRLVATNRLRLRSEVGERRSVPGGSSQGGGVSSGTVPNRDRSAGPGSHGPSRVLDSLALTDREALLLVVLSRLDYPQAAQVLGITVATLVSRLSHVRDQIGHALWSEADQRSGGPDHLGRGRPSYLRLVK